MPVDPISIAGTAVGVAAFALVVANGIWDAVDVVEDYRADQIDDVNAAQRVRDMAIYLAVTLKREMELNATLRRELSQIPNRYRPRFQREMERGLATSFSYDQHNISNYMMTFTDKVEDMWGRLHFKISPKNTFQAAIQINIFQLQISDTCTRFEQLNQLVRTQNLDPSRLERLRISEGSNEVADVEDSLNLQLDHQPDVVASASKPKLSLTAKTVSKLHLDRVSSMWKHEEKIGVNKHIRRELDKAMFDQMHRDSSRRPKQITNNPTPPPIAGPSSELPDGA